MENRERCKRIAETLDRIAAGEFIVCPECGDYIDTTDAAGNYNMESESFTCPHCGATVDECDAEYASMYDYFQDCYDVEYRINGNKEYRSVELLVAFGGPNIYVDTGAGRVKLYWWTEYADYPLKSETRDAIDDAFQDLFNC